MKDWLSRIVGRAESSELAQANFDAGAIVAIGTLFVLGYYIYQLRKTPDETPVHQTHETTVNQLKDHKFEMEWAIKWTRKVLLMTCTKQ